MNLKKLSQGSSLLMGLAVVLSASVLVSAYGTFSNEVFTSHKDFKSLYGMTLSAENVTGEFTDFATGAEHNTDTIYDQGLNATSTDFSGSYHIVVRILCDDMPTNMYPSDINSISVYDTDESRYVSLILVDGGNFLEGITEDINTAIGETDHYRFTININTPADGYYLMFTAEAA